MTHSTDHHALQRLPDLTVTIEDNLVRIRAAEGWISCPPHALALLDAFYQARPLAEGLARCANTGIAEELAALEHTAKQLYQAGILREEAQIPLVFKAQQTGYDSAPIHVAMLNDRERVSSFLAGIREVVQPGDVVIDLGTGTGIFAIAAAQAGARHVYAIEANGIGRHAQAAFHANGLSDRITLLHGWSTQLSLPERANVLISEMVGNEPTADYVLEVMMDARKRLLTPDARLVPGRVSIFGLPLSVPQAQLNTYTLTPTVTRQWQDWYGIDLPAAPHNHLLDGAYAGVRPYEARDWLALSEPVLLADINLMDVQQLMLDLTVPFTATQSGVLNGVLVYFEVQMGPKTRFSLHPARVPKDSFRYSPLWLMSQPLTVQAGERLDLVYRYRVPGKHDGVGIAVEQASTPIIARRSTISAEA